MLMKWICNGRTVDDAPIVEHIKEARAKAPGHGHPSEKNERKSHDGRHVTHHFMPCIHLTSF